ncbi:hypothetical protein Tco_0718712 [Tanacetum coccineum]
MRCCVENGDGVVAAVVGCAKVVVCFGDGDEVGDGVGVRVGGRWYEGGGGDRGGIGGRRSLAGKRGEERRCVYVGG